MPISIFAGMDAVKTIEADINERIQKKVAALGLKPTTIDAELNGKWVDVLCDKKRIFAIKMKVKDNGKRIFKYKLYASTKKSN